jgi:acetyl esterase
MAVQSRIVLEPSAQAIVDATSTPPFLYELEPAAARKVLDDLQAAPIDKLPVQEEWITVPAAVGDARVRIVKPVGSSGMLPVIVYMHGGGWILGNAGTHAHLSAMDLGSKYGKPLAPASPWRIRIGRTGHSRVARP